MAQNNITMMTQAKTKENLYKALIYAFLLVVALVAISMELSAQESNSSQPNLKPSTTYNNAIGVRAGGTSGSTFKTFVGRSSALEFIAWGNRNWLGITALYERYTGAFNVSGLNWYYGLGGHANFYDSNWRWADNQPDNDVIGLGVDGIVGLEYKIPPIPVAVSLDLKPNIEAYTNGGMGFHIDPGLGIKFAF